MQSNQLKMDPQSIFKNQDKKFAKIFGMSPQDYAVDLQTKMMGLDTLSIDPNDFLQSTSESPSKSIFKNQDKKFAKIFGMSPQDYAGDLQKKMKGLDPFLSEQKDFLRSVLESPSIEYDHSENASIALTAGPNQIIARAFWWGFHVEIPNNILHDITTAGNVTAILLSAAALGFAVYGIPPVAIVIGVIALAIKIEGEIIRQVNQGKGVYLSWSWPQVALIYWMPWLVLPLPTPVR